MYTHRVNMQFEFLERIDFIILQIILKGVLRNTIIFKKKYDDKS